MVSFTLSVVVMLSSGGLLADRTPTAGMLVGATDLNAQSAMYDNMTVAELSAERARVASLMPSLGAGIALTAVGGGVLLTGLFLIAVAEFVEIVIVGVVLVVASLPLLIVGPILLASAARERRETQTTLKIIDQRIAAVRRDEVAPSSPSAPEYDPKLEPPPPPPVRPPSSQFAPVISPSLVLASF